MAETNVFTGGVKPGGLTSSTEVRLLLCYLIQCAGPLTRQEIETALLEEQLVNYFEICDGMADVLDRGLVRQEGEQYCITDTGTKVARELEEDLPRSVRTSAVKAAIRAQVWNQKSAAYHADVRETADGYSIRCSIEGVRKQDFSLELMMPDRLTAEMVKKRFVLRGNEIYQLLLDALTAPGADET